jgi:hypothetical protein
MTYQLALAGSDGIVIASDQCERVISSNQQFAAKNMVRKIIIDKTKRYAWACSGSEAALIFARNVQDAIGGLGTDFSEEEALNALEKASRLVVPEYQPLSHGPWPCKILFVCGPTRRIFSHPMTRADERIGKCVSGMEFNLASFLPLRLDLSSMPARALIYLAAYSIRAAHDLDSAFVDGLDIAVYSDSTAKFEFVDSSRYWNEVGNLDARIQQAIREAATHF